MGKAEPEERDGIRHSGEKRAALGRGAFSMLELLIVLLIGSILTGGILVASQHAPEKAEFARLLSDIRTLRGAAALHAAETGGIPYLSELERYVDRSISDRFLLYADGDSCFIGFTGPFGEYFSKKASEAAVENGLLGGFEGVPSNMPFGSEEGKTEEIWARLK